MDRCFQLNGQRYEYVVTAEDQSHRHLGKIAVYREAGTQTYLTMPLQELETVIKAQQPIDWRQRLALYKQRFVGRNDIYAERYWNKKQQRKAYSPAGPWENGHKSETQHDPLTDTVLMRHFSNTDEYAIGLYPMTSENTTPFLAIDIDSHNDSQPWQALTTSLHQVCVAYHVPHLIELSQSGRGSHVWIFFNMPILASTARQLGDALLRATQSIDPRLPFTAFDRMFPAQDQVGGKQFGNLIAAPLEGVAQQAGKSVFVDEAYHVLPDQWLTLEQVETLSAEKVELITQKIRTRVGFRVFDTKTESESDLFDQTLHIDTPLTVVRANALYIEKTALSKQQVLQLKWLASFRNPKFYEAQNNRMSVYNIPRIITLFQESPRYLVLPRGLEDELRGITNKINWVDKTKS